MVMEGELICENCKKVFTINKGIPNLVMTDTLKNAKKY